MYKTHQKYFLCNRTRNDHFAYLKQVLEIVLPLSQAALATSFLSVR
jgi:hypothetical protein